MRAVGLLFCCMIFSLVGLAGCGGSEEAPGAAKQGWSNNAISADKSTISYTTYGTGEVALVFVHGWSCDQSYWRFQLEEFFPDFKIVTVDLAGHGLSSAIRKDYTMPLFGADVAAVVKKMDLKKVVLVGHSMGGPVILQAASLLEGRVIGMVAVDALQAVSFNMDEEAVDPFVKAMGRDFPTAAGRFSRSMFLASADTNLVNEIVAGMSSAPPAVALSAMREMLLFDNQSTIDALNVPLHCIVSMITPIDMESWVSYPGGYSFETMPKVGHFIHMVTPERFNPMLRVAVDKFIEKSRGQ